MVFGEMGKGKTATLKTLIKQKFDAHNSAAKVKVFTVDGHSWEQIEENEATIGKLVFNLWDFSAQKVFDALHHIFMTEYGCYLLVFDATSLLNEETRKKSLECVQFWLFSKKDYSPLAPVMLVGTYCEDLTEVELKEVDELLSTVLGANSFSEVSLEKYCFLPIDNKSGLNAEVLRAKVSEVIKRQEFVKSNVPINFLKVYHMMVQAKKEILCTADIRDIMYKNGIEDEYISGLCLKFLSGRGLLTYFDQHDLLRRYVILDPEWMVGAIGDVIFDEDAEVLPKFSAKYSRDFRKFRKDGIMSKQLLFDIWENIGFTYKHQKFLLRIMIKSSLLGEYNFDNRASFLVPRLFNTKATESVKIPFDCFEGHFFIIDFSGEFDPKVIADDGETFVRYLPFGFFERLVCLCVEHSARFDDSMKPLIGYHTARMSFGVDVDFVLRTECNYNDEPMWIKFYCETSTSIEHAQGLVKTVYSMIESLRSDFFSTSNNESRLAISLLLPSSTDTGSFLASYNMLKTQTEASHGKDKVIRPSKVHTRKINLSAYSMWLNNAQDLVSNEVEEVVLDQKKNSINAASMYKDLPAGLNYHCFLSYKQKSAIDMVGKQFYILKSKGYKCWYDQDFAGELNLANMQEGVRKSMCYLLFLSKDVFPSRYIEEEVKIAIAEKKPIIFLHHPDTGKFGYSSFDDYIQAAPAILKPFFSTVESIQLQRRYYLEAAVTKLLDTRLQEIYDESTV